MYWKIVSPLRYYIIIMLVWPETLAYLMRRDSRMSRFISRTFFLQVPHM